MKLVLLFVCLVLEWIFCLFVLGGLVGGFVCLGFFVVVVVMAVWRSQWPFFHFFHTATKLVENAIRKTIWLSECFHLGARACPHPSQKKCR